MTLHVRHIFFYIFSPSTKMWKCLISRLWRTWTQDHDPLFLFLNFDTVLEFNSRKNCQHLMNWTRWNKRNKVWSSETSLFKWHFHRCRHHCYISSLLRADGEWGGGDFPRLLWMWPIATFIGKQNQNTTKRNPQLFDSLPTRCIYLATYNLSGMIPCYDALVNFPKSKRFFIWMKSNNLALKSWSALPHTCSITMHVTLFFVVFRPKYVVPSQLLRSVRLVNPQFRGYGQQVRQLIFR